MWLGRYFQIKILFLLLSNMFKHWQQQLNSTINVDMSKLQSKKGLNTNEGDSRSLIV